MIFRPFPVLTIVAIPILAALIWLGVWQLQRAEWKTALIATYERTADAAPMTLEAALCGDDEPLGDVVASPGASGPSLRMFGHSASGAAGWRLFQASPGRDPSLGAVLVETAFEPLAIGGEIGAPVLPAEPAPSRFMVEAWPARSLLSAENDPAANEWHWFDPALMSTSLGVPTLDTRYVLVASAGMPDFLTRTPAAGHIGYAVTWFGMAIGFVLIYAAFHARAGRLRFRRQGPDRP